MKPGLLSRLRYGARRFVRRLAERALSRTYDGAEPPPRLVDEVRTFSELNPRASSEEWGGFALALAAGAWRDGFAYGVEWRERWDGERVPHAEELMGEGERRARLWVAPGVRAQGDPLLDVPVERQAEVLRELEFAYGYGGFRFVDGETSRPIFSPAALPLEEEELGDDYGAEGAEGDGGPDAG